MVEEVKAITKSTPVTTTVGVVIAIAVASFFMGSKLNEINAKLARIEAATQNRWTSGMEEESWVIFGLVNSDKGIQVPDIREIVNRRPKISSLSK